MKMTDKEAQNRNHALAMSGVYAVILMVLVFLVLRITYQVGVIEGQKLAQSTKHSRMDLSSQINLRSWFADFNGEYFGNRLPQNTEVEFASLGNGTDFVVFGTTSEQGGGYRIQIDDRLRQLGWDRLILATLILESCHVETYSEVAEHGVQWEKCMHRVADAGGLDKLW